MDFLRVRDAAAALRVSYSTVLRLIHNGDLPSIKLGRQYRVRLDQVASHCQTIQSHQSQLTTISNTEEVVAMPTPGAIEASQWLRENKSRMIKCPYGLMITRSACQKRQATITQPKRHKISATALLDNSKCKTCSQALETKEEKNDPVRRSD